MPRDLDRFFFFWKVRNDRNGSRSEKKGQKFFFFWVSLCNLLFFSVLPEVGGGEEPGRPKASQEGLLGHTDGLPKDHRRTITRRLGDVVYGF